MASLPCINLMVKIILQNDLCSQSFYNNRKVGAVSVAKMAASTFFGGYGDRPVQGLIKVENFFGAKLHADMAAFTPVGINKNLPARPFSGFTGRINHSRFFHVFPSNLALKMKRSYALREIQSEVSTVQLLIN
jgi:hypothetical protein